MLRAFSLGTGDFLKFQVHQRLQTPGDYPQGKIEISFAENNQVAVGDLL